MKKFLFCCAALCFSLILKSQNPAVAIVNNNVLYAGVANPVIVAAPGVAAEKLVLISDDLEILKTESNNYLLTPKPSVVQAVLSFVTISGKDTSYFGSFMFKVKQLPAPSLTFVNQQIQCNQLTIDRNLLRVAPILSFRYFDELFNIEREFPTVVSFSIAFNQGGNIVTKQINGNKLPADIVNELLSLPKGETVNFDNINVRWIDGSTNRESSFNLILM